MTQPTTVGAGIIVTFSSGFVAELLSVDGPNITRDAIDTTSSLDTWKLMIPSAFTDPGEFTCEMNFDPDDTPPIVDVAETITITYPIAVGETAGATWSASGFMTSFSPSTPIEDRMTATATFQLSGVITFTDGA